MDAVIPLIPSKGVCVFMHKTRSLYPRHQQGPPTERWGEMAAGKFHFLPYGFHIIRISWLINVHICNLKINKNI